MNKFRKLSLVLLSMITIISLISCGMETEEEVVTTEVIRVFGNEWSYSDPLYIVDKSSDLLTQDIVDNGSAHLYLEMGDGMWMALPYSTMGYGVTLDDLGIWTEGSSVTSQTTTFKLVVIEGTMQTDNVDFNNYNEVKEHYNLND
jgi:hypothetical protein